MRLLGFERVELKPGESRYMKITADPRLLARLMEQSRNGGLMKEHMSSACRARLPIRSCEEN
jgi:hypothetical protein